MHRPLATVLTLAIVTAAGCSSSGGGQGLPDFQLATTIADDAAPTTEPTDATAAPDSTVAPTTTADTTPDTAPTAPAEPAYPRTVDNALGSTEIAEQPERVVAVSGVADIDALLSLGVVPHAAAAFFPVNAAGDMSFAPWNQEYWGEVQSFLNRPQVNLEELATFDPDMIVGQIGSVESNDTMAAIAPVVAYDYPADWREPVRIFGEALDREAEAEAAIADVEARIAEIAERVPDGGLTLALITNGRDGNFTVYTPEHGAGIARALDEIGISYVDVPTDLSKERMGDLAPADWIVVYDFSVFDVNELLDDPLFQQLPAVQAGNVVSYDPIQTFATLYETSRSLPYVLDTVLTSIGL
ncbi:ABC transporter substrate-binding protein [Ilumatobacter coccineus]|uniref:ABC transporter substrate-binding protein n=1 Tax=Ilumatobacter coccineus TaxID=467094 RepID=UPI000348B9C5|nr:ABC transporter substrate-binding protein [Ilumatobacter coccineus]